MVQYPSRKFFVDTSENGPFKEIWPPAFKYFVSRVGRDDSVDPEVYCIGSSFGYGALAMQAVFPGARVTAIDPNLQALQIQAADIMRKWHEGTSANQGRCSAACC